MQIQSFHDVDIVAKQDDYDELPEPIKQMCSREEYLWMSDAQKARLVEQECEPEW